MIEAIALCVSVLVYGPRETTAIACHGHVTAESRQTMILKTQPPRAIAAVPAKAVVPMRLRAKPVHRIAHNFRPKREFANLRKSASRTRCGSERSHWYWNKRLHRRRYRCR
jgi:hypothetical protein